MNITTELIQTIYQRAYEYAAAKWGSVPDRIALEEDGSIVATWIDYCCGETSEETNSFEAESLTENLDAIIAERLERERQKRIIEEARRREREREQEIREKQNRKLQYMQLKKEFE